MIPGRELVVSWVLYAMRFVFNREDIRTRVLQNALADLPGLTYGPTWTPVDGAGEQALLAYVRSQAASATGPVLFTASNLPDPETYETHYQTFILDPRSRLLWAIDPSRTAAGREGVYAAPMARFLGDRLPRPYRLRYVPVSATCQTDENDVFCQTWSLWLQIQAVRALGERVAVPSSQQERYALLLTFYQDALRLPNVCEALTHQYADELVFHRTSILQGARVPKTQRVAFMSALRAVDPCAVLRGMVPEDMN
jgi:hypothetical protein